MHSPHIFFSDCLWTLIHSSASINLLSNTSASTPFQTSLLVYLSVPTRTTGTAQPYRVPTRHHINPTCSLYLLYNSLFSERP